MALGRGIAKAEARANDIEHKLFLKRNAADEKVKLKLYGPSGPIGEIERGWNLDLHERTELTTGARYFNLFVSVVNDPDGELLRALKTMTKVKVGSTDFSVYTKPSFLSAIPSYTFRLQPVGQS